MKSSFLQKKIDQKNVKCLNCSHYCILKDLAYGKCGVRQNKNGEIFAHNYQKICSLQIDPIEKKPLYHFLPGTETLSVGSLGCCFSCKNCQNWTISQIKNRHFFGDSLSSEKLIQIAKENKLKSISYTYTEPITFSEYVIESMIEAKKEKIKNIWVSNGFFSEELLERALPYIDAINIDLKAFSDQFYQEITGGKLEPVLKAIKKIARTDTHLEITTLLISTKNDDLRELKEMAKFISNLSNNIPWHITRFFGDLSWKMKDVPDTPISLMEKVYKIGKDAGLNFVYLGNIESEKQNSYCPNCDNLIIQRMKNQTKIINEAICIKCGHKINLIN